MSEQLAKLEKKGGGGNGLLVRNPILTSDTGEAIASSIYDARYTAWMAFAEGDNGWTVANGQFNNAWIAFHFGEKLHPKLANIMTRDATNTSSSTCSNLVLECSNDGTNWTQIQCDYNVFDSGVPNVHQLLVTENAPSYSYFRVKGTFSTSGYGFKVQFFGEK